MMKEVTKESISMLLQTNDRAVERAIVVLFERQTRDEKAMSIARHDNQRGFSAAHASKGCYYARWIRSGRNLTGRHLENARRMTQHYLGQLLQEARDKQSRGHSGAREGRPCHETAVPVRPKGMSQEEHDRAMANVRAGRCPDGCCGPHEDEPRPGYNEDMEGLEVERHMHEMEVRYDRLQSAIEEVNKRAARRRMEVRGGYVRVQEQA